MKNPIDIHGWKYRVSFAFVFLVIFALVFSWFDHFRKMQMVCDGHDFSLFAAGTIVFFLAISLFAAWTVNKIIRDQNIYAENLEVRTQKMRELAIIDGLTKVYNHRYFEHKLEKEWERFERFQHALACVMIDIDDFKKVNDCFGHRAGDVILRGVADLLRANLREVDVISRYGGEEFVILLLEKPSHLIGLRQTMEKIRMEIATQEFIFDGQKIRVTASFGGAMLPNSKIISPDSLVNFADKAMYRSKKNGKNCVSVFDERDCC